MKIEKEKKKIKYEREIDTFYEAFEPFDVRKKYDFLQVRK